MPSSEEELAARLEALTVDLEIGMIGEHCPAAAGLAHPLCVYLIWYK